MATGSLKDFEPVGSRGGFVLGCGCDFDSSYHSYPLYFEASLTAASA
jgi:hypothetical protein